MGLFDLNTNLLDTNSINLAVVITLSYVVGKDPVTNALASRQKETTDAMRTADNKFKQSQLELDRARAGLLLAGEKVLAIKEETRLTIETMRIEGEREIKDLEKSYDELESRTIRLAQRKFLIEIYQTLVVDGFKKARFGLSIYMIEQDLRRSSIGSHPGYLKEERVTQSRLKRLEKSVATPCG
jgi:F0F1-type ATP synthase membrane subunit b/b'